MAAATEKCAGDVAPAIVWLLTGKRAKKDTLPVQRLDEEIILKKVCHYRLLLLIPDSG